jgi:hypothetical protein
MDTPLNKLVKAVERFFYTAVEPPEPTIYALQEYIGSGHIKQCLEDKGNAEQFGPNPA